MNYKINSTIALSLAGAMLVLGSILPASAQTLGTGMSISASAQAVGVTSSTRQANAAAKLESIATREITRRTNALNALNTRINAMVRVPASDKSSLSATIQSQLTAMTTLQGQVTADASSSTALKADMQTMTQDYRIFILVIPQGAIEAASDRVLTIASDTTTLAGKLQARITTDQNAGDNVSAEQASLTDLNVKVSDAGVQAQAAITEVASLSPDQGNTTVQQSNTAALKDARSKIQTAQQDLRTARQDAGSIVKGLLSLGNPGQATTTTP